jgi:arabinoxylan arabinofuranohydrolase
MTSISGSAKNMPAPYLFEASELNIIGGRFVYTYNTSWSDRNDWSKYTKRNGQAAPSSCSMCYMVSDTPLDPDSWEYRGEYVPNEGNFGMGWGNNHTHLHKYQGTYYLFYHSTVLESAMNTGASGFRSIGVNKATVTENTQKINKMTLNKTGVTAIKKLNPYLLQEAETMANSGGVSYEDFTNISKNSNINTLGNDASRNLHVKMKAGSWTQLRGVDFGTQGADSLMVRVRGTGTLEVRINSRTAKPAATIEFSSNTYTDQKIGLDPSLFTGSKNHLYFVFTSATNVYFDAWQFSNAETVAVEQPKAALSDAQPTSVFDLSGRKTTGSRQGIVVEQYIDQNGKKRSVKRVNTK